MTRCINKKCPLRGNCARFVVAVPEGVEAMVYGPNDEGICGYQVKHRHNE